MNQLIFISTEQKGILNRKNFLWFMKREYDENGIGILKVYYQ